MSGGKKNNKFLIILGLIVLGLLTFISIINLGDRDSYLLSTDIIKKIDYVDGKLVITTRDDMKSVCIKQTKSEPDINSLCWIDTINYKSTIAAYEYKTYYIWTKDNNDVITFYNKYNVQDN